MNNNPDPSTDLFSHLLDLDRIEKEGATLRVVTDNMRSVLACIAMLVACAYLFLQEPSHWLFKISSVIIGLWTVVYAVMACLQMCYIMMDIVFKCLHKIIKPEVMKNNAVGIAVVLGGISMSGVFGLLFLIASSVKKSLGS